jgi:hypothetical protein
MSSSPARPASEREGTGILGFLAGVVRGWDAFWFRPADPTTLCLIRVLAGFMVLYVHLSYSWGLFALVGSDGWFNRSTANWIRLEQPAYAPRSDWNDQAFVEVDKGHYFWSPFYNIEGHGWIVALHVIFLLAMLMFALGLLTRYTGLVTWVGAMAYVQRASITVFGMDTMMMILLCYLVIGPSGATFSLDRWWQQWWDRRAGRPIAPVEKSVLANFVIRLIQVHFCIIYLAGGTSKLLGATWWNGTALNLVMLNYSFAPLYFPPYRATLDFLAHHRWLWEMAASGGVIFTLFVELGFPFLVWDRRWRPVMVCGSILLHTGIGIFMGLVAFSLFMLIMVLSFVPPEVVRSVLAKLLGAGAHLLRKSAPPDRKPELAVGRVS